ncbi:MAG: CDP-diacylglycerol--serine O-phosphatidyltransferase [Elusimicrobiota bacterium]
MKFGIYIVNLVTMGNMAAGLLSIIFSFEEKFAASAWLILIAIIFDGLDGFLARATKTSSLLGIELDSFADFVSFCLAPGIMMYNITLWQYGTPGMIVGFIYVVFGAFRLARFNIKAQETKPHNWYIEGLPTPAAGGILAAFVLTFLLLDSFEMGFTAKTIPIIMHRIPFIFKFLPVIMIVLSFLMISKLRYAGLSRIKLTKVLSTRTFLLLLVGILLVLAYPENIIFVIFLIYVISGLVEYFLRYYSLRRRQKEVKS